MKLESKFNILIGTSEINNKRGSTKTKLRKAIDTRDSGKELEVVENEKEEKETKRKSRNIIIHG